MKLKTSKSAAKRIVKITRNNKVIMRKMSAQHLSQGKSKRTKKEAGKNIVMKKTEFKKLRKLLPNGVSK
jgi:ribosomal protein L35